MTTRPSEGFFEPRLVLAMREVRSVRGFVREYGATGHCLVQRASEIVNRVRCGESNLGVDVWHVPPHSVAASLRVRLALDPGGLRVELLCPTVDDSITVSDVAFGPF